MGVGDGEAFADDTQRLVNGRHGRFFELHVHPTEFQETWITLPMFSAIFSAFELLAPSC